MKTWIKALGIASAVEAPLLTVLMALAKRELASPATSIVGSALVGYHLLAIPIGQAVLTMWNPGTSPEPAPGSDVVYWFSVYAAQIVLTTPILVLLSKFVLHLRSRNSG